MNGIRQEMSHGHHHMVNTKNVLFKINFYCSRVVYNVVLVSAVQQSQLYIYQHFSRFSSHPGHHIAPSRVPYAKQPELLWYNCSPVCGSSAQ